MKKNVLFVCLACLSILAFVGCKSSMSHYVGKVNLDGNYILQNVQVTGLSDNAKYNVTLLNDVSAECFSGSEWTLPHNGNGSYTISGDNCYGGTRNIKWSVRSSSGQSVMQLKVLDGRKAKQVEEGYIMTVTNATNDGFTLQSPVSVDGNAGSVIYTFLKK